jgi:hypothetical protein
MMSFALIVRKMKGALSLSLRYSLGNTDREVLWDKKGRDS